MEMQLGFLSFRLTLVSLVSCSFEWFCQPVGGSPNLIILLLLHSPHFAKLNTSRVELMTFGSITLCLLFHGVSTFSSLGFLLTRVQWNSGISGFHHKLKWHIFYHKTYRRMLHASRHRWCWCCEGERNLQGRNQCCQTRTGWMKLGNGAVV